MPFSEERVGGIHLPSTLSYCNGQSYTFTWEDGNQLASATVGGKTIDFTYNSDGIRTKKSIDNTATYYYRLSGSKVIEMEVASVSSSTTDRYVFIYDAEGKPHEIHKYSAGASTPTKYFYVLNLQGDVIQLRDTSNAVVANYTYDAWGRLLSVKNASGSTISDSAHIANVNPIRYRGYFYDTETKLYYCNSRYYDPQIKRFINADEYLSTGQGFNGFNMFAYCANNPVMNADCYGWRYEISAGCGNLSLEKASIKKPSDPTFSEEAMQLLGEFVNDGEFVLYDNDRFRDETPYHEQLIVIRPSGPIFNPKENEVGLFGIEGDLYTGGFEFDGVDFSIFDFGHVEAGLEFKDGDFKCGGIVSAYSPSFDISFFGHTIEIGGEFGAVGVGAFKDEKSITISGAIIFGGSITLVLD